MSADVLERTYGLKWKTYILKIIYNLKEWKLWFIKKCMYVFTKMSCLEVFSVNLWRTVIFLNFIIKQQRLKADKDKS